MFWWGGGVQFTTLQKSIYFFIVGAPAQQGAVVRWEGARERLGIAWESIFQRREGVEVAPQTPMCGRWDRMDEATNAASGRAAHFYERYDTAARP